jgi:2-keto-3-deoxy-L-rhamnonate aldolase RhmA
MINKNKFLSPKFILGSWINSASPIMAEIMSASGFDFLVVDAEHSATDVPQALTLFQAMKAGNPNCFPMVRLPGNEYSDTKRYLDAGAMGVIVPLVNSAEEAEEVVRAVKYPPIGERGVGFGRSHGYGFEFDVYMKSANNSTFICIQIEHYKAVENIDGIFSTKGIDSAIIGPYDLSASMGITAQFNNKDYLKAYKYILAKCQEYNIIPGYHIVKPDYHAALDKIKEGFRMIAYSLDITILGTYCRDAIKNLKKEI